MNKKKMVECKYCGFSFHWVAHFLAKDEYDPQNIVCNRCEGNPNIEKLKELNNALGNNKYFSKMK
jgi:hypothetical protein